MKRSESRKVFQWVAVAMLGSMAYVLMMLNFPLPGLPPFLKIDFSEIPALFAAILFGPLAGIAVEGFKNFLHYGLQGSFTGVPIGQAANFLAGVTFILPTAYFARKIRSSRGLIYGLLSGSLLMIVFMGILNYLVILPAYTWFLNVPAMSPAATVELVLFGITPFNIIKSVVVSVLFFVLYVKMRPVLERYQRKNWPDAA